MEVATESKDSAPEEDNGMIRKFSDVYAGGEGFKHAGSRRRLDGKGFALGANTLGKKRQMAKDGRAESAPLVRGQQKDNEETWWAESSETIENFKGWKGPQMLLKGVRCPPPYRGHLQVSGQKV